MLFPLVRKLHFTAPFLPFPSLPSPRSRSCFLRGKWWGTPASGTTARTLTHPFWRRKNKFIEQECTGLGLFRRAHEKQSGCKHLRTLRPHTNLMFFCFPKDKDCLGQQAARPQTFFEQGSCTERSQCYFTVQPVQKLFPEENPFTVMAQRGPTSTFLFWVGKSHAMFHKLRKVVLRVTAKREATQHSLIPNQETFIVATVGWSTGPQVSPHA